MSQNNRGLSRGQVEREINGRQRNVRRQLSESSDGDDPEPYVKTYRIEIRGPSVEQIARKEIALLHFLERQGYEAAHVTEGRIVHKGLEYSSAMELLEPDNDGFEMARRPMTNVRQPNSTPFQVKPNPKESNPRKRSSLKERGNSSGPGPAAPSKTTARKQEATPVLSDEEEDEVVSMVDEEGPKKRTVSQFEFTCLVCDEILKTNANLGKRVLINHALARHISTNFYQCCEESFHTMTDVKRHFKVQHHGQKFEGFGPKEMWQIPEFVEAVKTCFGGMRALLVQREKDERKKPKIKDDGSKLHGRVNLESSPSSNILLCRPTFLLPNQLTPSIIPPVPD